MSTKLKITVASYSDKGLKEENQDALSHLVPDNLALLSGKGAAFTLADGVSSSVSAKEASQSCVTGFLSDYFSTPDSGSVKKSGGKVLTATIIGYMVRATNIMILIGALQPPFVAWSLSQQQPISSMSVIRGSTFIAMVTWNS